MYKVGIILLSLIASSVSYGAYVDGVNSKILKISSYGSGAVVGDVTIQTDTPVVGCESGYYVSNGNLGKKEILSIALSAFHTASAVRITAFDSPRWAGSTGNVCVIEAIHIEK